MSGTRPMPVRLALAPAGAALAVLCAGCASAEEPGAATPSPAPGVASPTAEVERPEAEAAEEQVREIDVTVADGEVSPPTDRIDVAAGERLRITVTSDVADELHVHGLGDPELALAPGVPGSLEVLADETGQFEVETHGSGLVLFTLAVR